MPSIGPYTVHAIHAEVLFLGQYKTSERPHSKFSWGKNLIQSARSMQLDTLIAQRSLSNIPFSVKH